jgi:hypothetical protein
MIEVDEIAGITIATIGGETTDFLTGVEMIEDATSAATTAEERMTDAATIGAETTAIANRATTDILIANLAKKKTKTRNPPRLLSRQRATQ